MGTSEVADPSISTFPDISTMESESWFLRYKRSLMESIGTMLDTENLYTDSQQRGLQTIRDILIAPGNKELPADDFLDHQNKGSSVEAILKSSSDQTDAGFTRTLYTLACHLAYETERLGVDPASFYMTLAQLYSESMHDLKSSANLIFTLPGQESLGNDKMRQVFIGGGQREDIQVLCFTMKAHRKNLIFKF